MSENEDMSSAENGPPQNQSLGSDIPYRINTSISYDVNAKSLLNIRPGILVDRGANGCIAGRDASLVERTDRFIDLTGVDNHTVRQLNIVHAAYVIDSQLGPVIVHVPQAAFMPDAKSILSPLQLEAFGCTINDKASEHNNGEHPCVTSPDGYKFPCSIRHGLPYLDARPVRASEWNRYPSTYLTSDTHWDPKIHDRPVDPDFYRKFQDEVRDISGLPEGVDKPIFIDEIEDSDNGVDRTQIHANLAQTIEDELVDSVLEYNINGKIHHHHLAEGDYSCDWGEYECNRMMMQSNDSRIRRRSPRLKQVYATSEEDDPALIPTQSHTKQKRSHTPDPQEVTQDEHQDSHQNSQDDAAEKQPAGIKPTLLDDELNEDGDDDTPLTDYNNPAKSTHQNEPRTAGPYMGKPTKHDYAVLARNFLGVPQKVIEKTFENTTQRGRLTVVRGLKLWKRHKAPYPALNVVRRNEPVATDTIYGPAPCFRTGATAAQLFVGRKSGYIHLIPLGDSDKQFPKALYEVIRESGAMDILISDNAAALMSEQVQQLTRILQIKFKTIEPYNKNQSFSERTWQNAKHRIEVTLNMSNAPPECWLLCGNWIAFVSNRLACERLHWRSAYEWLKGSTPDITMVLCFIFFEPVYYPVQEYTFGRDSDEALGRFVGAAETVGHELTFLILTEARKVIARSVIRSARLGGIYRNLRANEAAPSLAPKPPNAKVKIAGKEIPIVIETVDDEEEVDQSKAEHPFTLRSAMEKELENGGDLPTLDSSSFLGRTFITTPDDSGEQRRATIEQVQLTKNKTPDGMQPLFKFKCRVGTKTFEEVMTYNRMLEWIEMDQDKDDFYRIEGIVNHRRNQKSPSGWEVLVEWASGQVTWNDLTLTFQGDPVTVSMYAKKQGLLDKTGWRRCKRYVRNVKTLGRAANQVRLKNYRNRPVYMYGYQVPRDYDEAMLIDEKNGNDKWQQSIALEMSQHEEYETFENLGKGTPIPEGHTKIPCHFVFAVKACGRHKSRLVAGGHRTSTPTDSTYSGVVSLLGIRMVTFLAELNELELWSTDVGNAYLESYTSEKICIIAGAEFGELEGCTLRIRKALYGLKSSGRCWHDRLHDVLRELGWTPSKSDSDIYMRDCGDHYEYIAVYVDDLLIASNNPKAIIDSLTSDPFNFKLKGTGPTTFHLGCNFTRDDDGTLCMSPLTYIERMESQYISLFGESPKQNIQSPLERNDHPELDDSPLLDVDGVAKYQSLIGSMQWAISLGRFDIATAVMTMSSFRAAPREQHLARVKRMVGYLCKFRHAALRVRTGLPDYSDLPVKDYDWARSVYGRVREQKVADAPPPKGKTVITTTYVDANLYHDQATGRAVTGVLHYLNQTPINWYSKKQATVETATYGSEFSAARTAIQQITALRIDLQYLGVPLHDSSMLFGDNESVVTSATIPHSQLGKRHVALSYHYTREAIASKMVDFHHIPGDINPADILSKHWGHSQVYETLRPLFFYRGDTTDLLTEEDRHT